MLSKMSSRSRIDRSRIGAEAERWERKKGSGHAFDPENKNPVLSVISVSVSISVSVCHGTSTTLNMYG